MEGDYAVKLGDRVIGSATVERRGLYYHFRCRCGLTGDVMCRLVASCGGQDTDLGVLVPTEGGFGLDTKLPAKRLGVGVLAFRVEPKRSARSGVFVPIRPEEPFSYLSQLSSAYLAVRDGQIGAMMPDCQTESSNPTGQ